LLVRKTYFRKFELAIGKNKKFELVIAGGNSAPRMHGSNPYIENEFTGAGALGCLLLPYIKRLGWPCLTLRAYAGPKNL
jgi:hypothetical protein